MKSKRRDDSRRWCDDVLSRGLFEEILVLFRDLSLLFEMQFSCSKVIVLC